MSANSEPERLEELRKHREAIKRYIGKFAEKGIEGCTGDENIMRAKLAGLLGLVGKEYRRAREEEDTTDWETADEGDIPSANDGKVSNPSEDEWKSDWETEEEFDVIVDPVGEGSGGGGDARGEIFNAETSRTDTLQVNALAYSIGGCCNYVRSVYDRICRESLPSFPGHRLFIDNLFEELARSCTAEEMAKHAVRIVGTAHPFCNTSSCDHEDVVLQFSRYLTESGGAYMASQTIAGVVDKRKDNNAGLAANSQGRSVIPTSGRSDNTDTMVPLFDLGLAKNPNRKTRRAGQRAEKAIRKGSRKSPTTGGIHRKNTIDFDVDKELNTETHGGRQGIPRLEGGTEKVTANVCPNVGDDSEPRRGEGVKSHAISESNNEGIPQLHPKGILKLVGQDIPDRATSLTSSDLANTESSVQSRRIRPNARGGDDWEVARYRRTTKRVLRDQQGQKTAVGGKPGRKVLGSGNASDLLAQRNEGYKKSSLHGSGTNEQRNGEGAYRCSGKFCPATRSKPCNQLGRTDRYVPSTEKENVQKGVRFAKDVWRGFRQTRDSQFVRQVGKVEDRRERWGSKADSSSNERIQPPVRSVHKTDRKGPLQFKGSHVPVERYIAEITSQREESISKSRDAQTDMEGFYEACELQPGFEPLGRPRRDKDVKSYASVLSKDNTGHGSGVSSQSPIVEPSNDTKSIKIPKPRRGHKWRYDDGTRQLCCSLCDTGRATRYYATLCRQNRKNHLRKEDKRIAALLETMPRLRGPDENQGDRATVSKYRSAARGISEFDTILDSGRRRRSRDRDGYEVGSDARRNITVMVEVDRSRDESRRQDRQVLADRVLPAQTVQTEQQPMGDVTIPVEGSGNRNSGGGKQPAQVAEVPNDNLGSQSQDACRNTGFRAPIPKVGEQELDERTDECRPTKTVSVGNRLPVKQVEGSTKLSGDLAGTAANVRETVGDKSNRTGTDREMGRVEALSPGGNGKSRQNPEWVNQNDPIEIVPNVFVIDGDAIIPHDDEILCHCVGGDLTMGRGFAKMLKEYYGRPNLDGRPLPLKGGTNIRQNISEKFDIVHMVVKPKSGQPGSEYGRRFYMQNLRTCLSKLASLVPKERQLALPYLVGCGLDKMYENDVLALLSEIGVAYNRNWVLIRF